ncbi:MAG: hypothetical protein K2J74_03490, partial [Muribaculaceae bacterium]|nr:hypothetical protein [Muribaculaceae bacterium]
MKTINIKISDEIRRAAPEFKMIKIQAQVQNTATSESLISLMNDCADRMKEKYAVPDINLRPGIAATRQAYKACGKDPNRYRPSQEQLMRRIVNGKELYFISNVVDVFNYMSIVSGYSIGAFDVDKIEGDTLTLGVGQPGEPYEGIGRGVLNIEGMPVYRDLVGGVGTPTSDNERTKIDNDTTSLVVCSHIYGEEMPGDEL